MWNSIKAWFKHSETIFIARLTQLSGLLLSVGVGFNWDRFVGIEVAAVHKTQLIWMGVITFIQGLLVELARRRNASFDPLKK